MWSFRVTVIMRPTNSKTLKRALHKFFHSTLYSSFHFPCSISEAVVIPVEATNQANGPSSPTFEDENKSSLMVEDRSPTPVEYQRSRCNSTGGSSQVTMESTITECSSDQQVTQTLCEFESTSNTSSASVGSTSSHDALLPNNRRGGAQDIAHYCDRTALLLTSDV